MTAHLQVTFRRLVLSERLNALKKSWIKRDHPSFPIRQGPFLVPLIIILFSSIHPKIITPLNRKNV